MQHFNLSILCSFTRTAICPPVTNLINILRLYFTSLGRVELTGKLPTVGRL